MRRLAFCLILIGIVWLVGLTAFITTLPAPATATSARSEAVIVYTGGGGARITAGMTLLADGNVERLLISGVHPDISREQVAEFWVGEPALFDCCVDLGWEARSTTGNADEAAQWARKHDIKRIILVTSDFHMPRALTETRITMPDAEITPHAVASGYLDDEGRPISFSAWRNLAGEFNKFVLARTKSLFAFTRK